MNQERNLSDAQKAALPGIKKRAKHTAMFIMAKEIVMLLLGCMSVAIIDGLLLNGNTLFVVFMGIATGILVATHCKTLRQEAIAKYSKELIDVK